MKLTKYFIIIFVLSTIFQQPGAMEIKKDSEKSMGNVVVTARKQKENIQNVPVSISVFGEDEIIDSKIDNTFDLIQFSPNIHIQDNYLEHIVVTRGVSSFNTSLYSPMGYYVDDVGYSLNLMHKPDFLDIERIEILRGPQGTLYGRNSESGVINIITKSPDNEFKGRIIGEYGDYNSSRLGFRVSGPLKDEKIFAGVAFQAEKSDGHVDNKHNNDNKAGDSEGKNGRISIRWTPSTEFDISLISNFLDNEKGIAGYRWIDGEMKTDAYKVFHDTPEDSKQKGNDQVVKMEYKGLNFNLLSVSSHLYHENDNQMEADLWNSPLRNTKSNTDYKTDLYSQELRLSSPKDNNSQFKWLLGVYGFSDETEVDYSYHVINNAAWHMKDTNYMNPITTIDGTGIAGFGQGTYTMFDKLHLTLGIRYDKQTLKGEIKGKYLDMKTFSQADYHLNEDLKTDEILPKFSIAYDLTKEIMGYFSASRGYITGGFNYCNTPNQMTLTYDPEYTWNYEAGIKSMWFHKRLMANLSIFHIDIEDKQVSVVNGDIMSTGIENAAEAHSTGAELELKLRPLKGFDLFAGIGYTEAKFDDFISTEFSKDGMALVKKDYKDNYLPYAPKWTYNFGAQYRHVSGIFSRADIFGTDDFYGDYANRAKQDAYHTINLQLGYESDRFDCILFAKNLFDEEYLTYLTSFGKNNVGLDGSPRRIGLTLRYRF